MRGVTRRILMLVESAFPNDTRVKNEAKALVKAGYKVSVIGIRKYSDEKMVDEVEGVRVYRVPELSLFRKNGAGRSGIGRQLYRIKAATGYLVEFSYFTIMSLLVSLYVAITEGFDAIHIHNPPNTLFVIGAIYRLCGKVFVFDHHDLAPELYCAKYGVGKNIVYKHLVMEEKLCLRMANLVIATNESYKDIDMERGKIDREKIFIVRNGPDLEAIHEVPYDKELQNEGKKLLVYVGVMGPQDGVDYLLRSLREVAYSMNRTDFYCIIIGRGDAVEGLKALRDKLELQEYVRFTGRLPLGDLLRYLSAADVCLDPNPSNALNDHSTFIKVMEYMALGKPIVSYDLKETRYTAQDAAIYVQPNDEKAFADAIVRLMDDPSKRAKMGEFGRKRVMDELAWHHVSKELLLAYESILPLRSQVGAPGCALGASEKSAR